MNEIASLTELFQADDAPAVTAPYAVDTSKGSLVGTVNRQWAGRPDDQKFLSLGALHDQVAAWRAASHCEIVVPGQIEAVFCPSDPDELRLNLIRETGTVSSEMTNYAFTQVSRLAGAPAYYLADLPGPLAALNLNYGLQRAEQKAVKAYVMDDGATLLRAITSPRYGRIFDQDVVEAVMKLAGNGTGDTRWKVPGVIDWAKGQYNPFVDITKETTTLYASDRDIFLFLVDDTHPIEVGKLANGDPDLMFRGFYVWNSETGNRTFGISTMYLRGVCQNRNLWGVEGFNEVTFRHTAGAPEKFVSEAAPALLAYSESATAKLIEGVAQAKDTVVAKTDEERVDFLQKFGLSKKQAVAAVAKLVEEEQHPPENVWDMAQAVTAYARGEQWQDARLTLEMAAGAMLDKIKV
jgi:uncharacterized protein YjbJ (UPF0337 family)